MGPVTAWSHSRLSDFERCKFYTKLKVIDRIPEPARPLPPGKTEHANDRGTRVHDAAEAFVKGGVELIPELHSFRAEFERLRELYAAQQVSLEGEWAFNRDWESVTWYSSDTWCRVKCDAVVLASKDKAIVVDYKTGKRWGNELKHAEQIQLYQLGAFLRYPELKHVDVELWYTDLDELHPMSFTRKQGMSLLPRFETRGTAMTDCTEFPPSPSKYNCKWCPYKPVEKGGTGHCSVGE